MQGWSESYWKNLANYAPLPIMLAIFVGLAPQLRLYRSFFLEEINQDYVRTARAKGLPEKKVMLKHVLRNAHDPHPHQRRDLICRACSWAPSCWRCSSPSRGWAARS